MTDVQVAFAVTVRRCTTAAGPIQEHLSSSSARF